nr:hypothetical protein [Atopobium sp. oral taxon 416]
MAGNERIAKGVLAAIGGKDNVTSIGALHDKAENQPQG